MTKAIIIFRYIALFCFLLNLSYRANAQFVNYGTDPASWKWRYVKTQHYKLIYPEYADSVAYNYARFLEMAYPHEMKTMNHSINRRFPVIIHPGNMQSNGLVAYAPRRMELLSTPPSSHYAQSWDRQLALHESRHVLQTDKLMQGIFRPFYYLLGEQVSGISSFAVPSWFFEGDAVVTETAMSKSGRGRLPEFHMPFRTQMVNGSFFSFDKWYFGSYRDNTSTYYALGYHLASYARSVYGADVWDKVTHRFPRRFFSVPPFSNALKHYTGVNTKQLFNDTYASLNAEWRQQDSLYKASGFKGKQMRLTPANKYYTSYQYPLALDKETVVALKSGLADIASLVLVRGGKEEHLAYLGAVNSKLLYANGTVYWTEYVPGIRWTHQNYSVLRSFNLSTRQISTLTQKDRFLAPAIGEGGQLVAFSRPDINGTNHIVLTELGVMSKNLEFGVPGNAFVKDLAFMDNSRLAALLVGNNGISLWSLDYSTSEWDELLSPVFVNITSLFWQNGNIYFESGLNGINNIYRLHAGSGEFTRLTDARFGAFAPSLSGDGETLFFADYRADGYRIVGVDAKDLNNVPADLDNPYRFELAEIVAQQEGFCLDTTTVEDIPFNPAPYRKLPNLFRIHSWAPFYYDAMDAVNVSSDDFSSIVKPGAMILSQDALNTMIMQAGWYYDDHDHHGKIGMVYMGWLPVIDMTVDYGGKAFDLLWKKNDKGEVYGTYEFAGRRRLEAEMRMYIPFNLTRGHIIRGFQPSVSYFYTNDKFQQYKSGKLSGFQYLLSELRYYNYRRMALRDIYPRLGYQVRLQHLFSPSDTENYGSLYAARLTAYLPGMKQNDGLMLRFGYQYQDADGKTLYFPKRLLDKTRGYGYTYQTRQMITAKADYAFSLFCPDVSIGGLAYIKRFRSNLFYDFTANQSRAGSGWATYNAAGVDLIADCVFLRLNFPVSPGIRIVAPLDYGSVQVEGLFSISF